MLDRAVLAGRIHSLEDRQDGPSILRVKHLLQLREALDALLQHLPGFGLVDVEAGGVARIDIGQ